jgi:hypothetical protein
VTHATLIQAAPDVTDPLADARSGLLSASVLEAIVVLDACTCGHGRSAHEHWRPGSECALCSSVCTHYRPARSRSHGRLARGLRLGRR